MDAISAVALVSALVSLVTAAGALISSMSLIYRKGTDSFQTLERIYREMDTLSRILRDVEEVTEASQSALRSESPLTTALQHTCREFKERFDIMAAFLERFLRDQRRMTTKISRFRFVIKFAAREDELMLNYNSLRDSARLARDLASDLKVELLLARVDERFGDRLRETDARINYQLFHLTGSMATLLADEDDEENDGHQSDGHPNEDTYETDTTHPPWDIGSIPNTSQGPAPPERDRKRGGFRRMARIGRKMVELSETGFVRPITLIIETSDDGEQQHYGQKEIKVLSKLDTASDANLVSYDMLLQEGLREEMLIPIPVEKRVELHGLEGARCTPEWEVTLLWYKSRDMKRRQEKFLVVKNAPFEILFSEESSFEQLSDRAVLVSKGRSKPKKEVLDEIKAEEEKRRKALERVEKEYREAEASKRVPVRRGTTLI